MNSISKYRPINPRSVCNSFSAFCLWWTTSIYKLGIKKDIDLSDVYQPLKEYSSESLGNKSWNLWNVEKRKKNPKIYRVIFKLFGWEICLYFILALLRECILRVAQPIFLGYFMSYYVSGHHSITVEQSTLSAVGLVVCSLLYSVFGHPCAMGVFHLGMKYRTTLCSLVYRKSLHLHNNVLSKTNLGHMINLLSNDVRRFDMGTVLLNYLIVSPIQMCIMTYFIWKEIGVSSLFGLAVLVAQIPFQFWMGTRISKVRAQTAVLTDKRIQLLNEMISGIQVIKIYCWEDLFTNLINICRVNEIKKIRYTSLLRAINISFRVFNTRLCIFVSLFCYVLLGNEIDSQKVFVVVCFYEILKQTMTVWFPDSINQMKELIATFRRFENFLSKEEAIVKDGHKKTENNVDEVFEPLLTDIKFKFSALSKAKEDDQNVNTENDNTEPATTDQNKLKNNIIMAKNVFAKWDTNSDHYTLKDISFKIPNGRLIAITGCVASGKSSLLFTILRELDCLKGYLECNGSTSYSSQIPWLFTGTIRENILFGSEMNEDRYGDVCQVCALEEDFEILPDGDITLVGDRGIMLSGGQRARVGLARAIYKEADIYLLDDPLSAVDSKVGRWLFDNCIINTLKKNGKTVVLVTHQVQYLNGADQIIIMKDGSIISDGTFEELKMHDEFMKLLSIDVAITDVDKNYKETHKADELDKLHTNKRKLSMKSQSKEDSQKGKVKWKVYKSYIKACGTKPVLCLFLLLAVSTQFFTSGFDYWTKYWVMLQETDTVNITTEKSIDQGNTSVNYTNSVQYNIMSYDFTYFINDYLEMFVFTLILLGLMILSLSRTLMFYSMALKSSMKLHHGMLRSVIRATLSFFHFNSTGKILNRFSQDIGAVDDLLPLLVIEVVQVSLQLVGIVVIVSIINPFLFIPLTVIVVVIYYLKRIYLKTSRSITRCEAEARSYVFSHLSSSIQGLATIRAMSAKGIVTRQFDNHNDVYSSASHMFIGVSRAFAYWMDLVCVVFIAIVTFSFVFGNDAIGGNIGLAITQVIGLTTVLQWGVRQATALENQMISVERISEFSNIYPEPPLETALDKDLDKNWPESGRIWVDNIFLTYSRAENPSLNGVSFMIEPKQKVGIVGRTGSGKTSVANAIFRLHPYEGKIKIDDKNISKMGLHTLRSRISIIPQEPVLFSGTLRRNLDPFDKYEDEVLLKALEQVELKGVLHLQHPVSEGGNNFSVGERQLICLARAIISGNKIIILDEATANVDNKTDSIIQETIKGKFVDCTIIAIAHRLHTIMDSDQVIVMDSGRIVEHGSPQELLDNPEGLFHAMVEQTGSSTENQLTKMARHLK